MSGAAVTNEPHIVRARSPDRARARKGRPGRLPIGPFSANDEIRFALDDPGRAILIDEERHRNPPRSRGLERQPRSIPESLDAIAMQGPGCAAREKNAYRAGMRRRAAPTRRAFDEAKRARSTNDLGIGVAE